MAIELRQLRYFIAVAEERHFGRAAARLRIAQPGLSQQIKRLEKTTGVSLLSRDRRQVEVTKAGEAFLHYARLAVEAADRAVESARLDAGKTDVLKIGASGLGVFPGLGEVVDAFRTEFSSVQVDLEPGISKQVVAAIVRRELDVAAVFDPFEAATDVSYQQIGFVEPVLLCSSRHEFAALEAIPKAALLDETVVLWPRSLNPPLIDQMRSELFGGAAPRRVIESADLAETFAYVAGGDGVAVAIRSMAEMSPAAVVARPLEDAPRLAYGAAWLDPPVSPFVLPFIGMWRRIGSALEVGEKRATSAKK